MGFSLLKIPMQFIEIEEKLSTWYINFLQLVVMQDLLLLRVSSSVHLSLCGACLMCNVSMAIAPMQTTSESWLLN